MAIDASHLGIHICWISGSRTSCIGTRSKVKQIQIETGDARQAVTGVIRARNAVAWTLSALIGSVFVGQCGTTCHAEIAIHDESDGTT